MSNELTTQGQPFSLAPRSLDEAFRLADMLADSDMVPKDYKGKPGNIIVAMQWGFEVGLKPLQALQNIAVINGRPSMWGDAVMALVRSSTVCEYVLEDMDASGTAICRAKRRGEPEQVRTFSDEDAKKAGLSGKQGPWSTSPKRMKQMRARSFALRDVFADVLKGMDIAEVVVDYTDLADINKANEQAQPRHASKSSSPARIVADAAAECITEERKHELDDCALTMLDAFRGGNELAAAELYYGLTDNEEKIYIWGQLRGESALRSFIKANHPKPQAAATEVVDVAVPTNIFEDK